MAPFALEVFSKWMQFEFSNLFLHFMFYQTYFDSGPYNAGNSVYICYGSNFW